MLCVLNCTLLTRFPTLNFQSALVELRVSLTIRWQGDMRSPEAFGLVGDIDRSSKVQLWTYVDVVVVLIALG